MQSGAGPRPGTRHPDVLPFVLATLAAAFSLLNGFDAKLGRDLGVYAYAGVTVADGVPPYVGIFNRAGPLAHALPAVGVWGARIAGADEVLGMRVWGLVLTSASVAVAYCLTRDLVGSRLAGAAASIALATFPAVSAYATGGPREKTPMLLFMLLALWAVVHRRWFSSGILIGLATLTLQTSLFSLLPAAAFAAWWLPDRGTRLRAFAAVAAGGAATVAVTLVCFALVGRLRELVEAFYLVNARYTTRRGMLADVPRTWRELTDGYGAVLTLFLGGLVVLVVLAVARAADPDQRSSAYSRLLAVGAIGTVTGTLWSLRDFDSWPDTYPLLPFVVLGIGAAVRALSDRAGRRVAVTVTAACLVVTVALGATYAITGRDDDLVAQRRSVAAALEVLPGAGISSIEAPEALVLAGQRNPTRHQMVSAGLTSYLEDTWPGGLDGFAGWLQDRPQQLVAVGKSRAEVWADLLAPRYVQVGRAPAFVWFVDRSVDAGVRKELRDALRVAFEKPASRPA